MFAVIMNGDTPLPIVIFDQQRTICAGPEAPLICHGCTAHKSDRLPPSPMAKRHGLSPVTVQPNWTTNHHNPTEQLLRLRAPRTKSPICFTLLPWLLEPLLRRHGLHRSPNQGG